MTLQELRAKQRAKAVANYRPRACEWEVGMTVVSKFRMTDYKDRGYFNLGEKGEIVKSTRSTVHVKDPRGHVHIRTRSCFDLIQEGK